MRHLVIDPPAFLAWFAGEGPGRRLRADYEAGALVVHVPRSFALGVLATAVRARRDAWEEEALAQLADEIDRIGFASDEPPDAELARWLARGLDAERAPYPALAAARGLPLVSADRETLRVAGTVARPLDGV